MTNRPTRPEPASGNVSACHLEYALGLISGKWKGLILIRLLERRWRFNELERNLAGCSARMLATQLKRLEGDGIVLREVFPEVPARVEYDLTGNGRELAKVVAAICAWSEHHGDREAPRCHYCVLE